jgi:hypothetical protein
MHSFQTYATFITNDTHRDLFFKGHLIEEWARVYPMLFDDQDLQIALNQRHMGIHYHEWFASVLLYHTTGLLSLVEAYAYKSHPRKQKVLEALVAGEILDFIKSRGVSSVTQCPDLLVYSADYSDWFFCEVKGPRDRLRESQVRFFEELSHISGKEIRIVQFQNSTSPAGD